MPEYNITSTDLRDAELFLAQFMREQVPEASFERGSATRDLMVKGFSYLYAFLRGEIDRVTARQSIKRIQEELTDEDDISQAIDEILSNWFLFRKDGDYVRMPVRLHFTERRAQNIAVASRFWRTNTLVFYLDSTNDTYVISESQLLPVFDSNGVLLDYVVDVPMKAARVGTEYQVDPGTFVRVEVPGGLPYFSYAENVEESSTGIDVESSDALIERSETAISTRNLINNRSCDATLQELFPAITDTLTVGMGETEMIRDRRLGLVGGAPINIGGHYDTYLNLPLTMVEENVTVGGYFVRPDGKATVFRDPELTYDLGNTFKTILGVQAGHVLYIRSGIISTPRGYVISKVTDHEIHINEATPFTEPSDEKDSSLNTVIYSIGWLSPDFANIELEPGLFQRQSAPSTTPIYEDVPWGTSRRIQESGKVVLDGRPIQDIDWVEVTDPDGGDPLIDPSTSTIIFNNRVNTTPQYTPEPAYTQYQVQVYNPELAQSSLAINTVRVGYPSDGVNPEQTFNGKNLRVRYRTLDSFYSIHTYTQDRNIRVSAANHIVKARHPVWVSVNIPYRLKRTATTTLDEDDASIKVAQHINDFNPNDDLDTSDISTFLRETYDVIGAVYPLTIYYHLDSPDGQQVFFSTTDIVSIFIINTNGVVLENGDDIIPPQEMQDSGSINITTEQELATYFLLLGISDRTVQYRSLETLITFEQRG